MGGRKPEHVFTIISMAFMWKLCDSKKLKKKKKKIPEQPLTFCKITLATRNLKGISIQEGAAFLVPGNISTENPCQYSVKDSILNSIICCLSNYLKHSQSSKNLTWILYSKAARFLVHSQGEFYSDRCWDAEVQKLQMWLYQNLSEDILLQKQQEKC